jgi:4-methyl-5(b-hydroxyethyl)-thiazole monophosphate biosynthesis
MDLTAMEMVIVPGGLGGVASIRASKEAMAALQFAKENSIYTAAICAGPTVLADLGITDGKNATCYPGCESGMGSAKIASGAAAVTDGTVITGTSAGCAVPFGLALIEALKGKETANTVAEQIVIR